MHAELEPWSEAARMAPRRLFLPWTRAPLVPRIRMLRVLTLAMLGYLLFLVPVLLILVDPVGAYPSGWLVGWAVVSGMALAGGGWVRSRRTEAFLLTSNEKTAYRQYTARMFVNFAVAEVPALIGFVICFFVDAAVPYLLALPVTLFLAIRYGPSGVDVATLQRALDERGRPYDLAVVLMQVPPPRSTP